MKDVKDASRRDFLKYGAVVTGAAVGAASIPGVSEIIPQIPKTARASETESLEIKEVLAHVSRSNIVVYDPGTEDTSKSRICIVNMYGSSRATDALPDENIKEFAKLGYRAARIAPRDIYFIDQIPSLSDCIDWIKANIEGVEKVVLWGNSRGCNLQSAYQRIAENGAGTFQGADMILPIPDMTLTPADAIIYCDANHGFAVNVLASLATNLVNDNSVMERTERLDPMSTRNGYLGEGVARYSEAFCREFWKAQARRYNRLLDKASHRMARIKAGKGMFSDDEPFCVVMGFGNVDAYQLYNHDIRFYSRTKEACKLLHWDGFSVDGYYITEEIVPTLRTARGEPGNFETMDKCYNTKVSEFLYLGMYVDEDNFGYNEYECFGVDWENNFSSPNGNSRYISCPTLAVGRTDGSEFEVAEWIYNESIASDKDLIFIEGMTHGGGCNDPAKYGDVAALENRYIDEWLQSVL